MINIEDMEVTVHTTQGSNKSVTVRILHKPTGISASATHAYAYYRAREEALKELRRKLDDAKQPV